MIKSAIITTVGLVIIWNTVSWIQHSLTFNPKRVGIGHDYNLKYHEGKLKNKINKDVILTEYFIDNINAVYMKNPKKNNCIIYCHGNSGTIENYMKFFYDFGQYANIIIFDYSGYGKSSGFPDSKIICDNAYDVWKFTVNKLGIEPENIILYGFSLGGAVASKLATNLNVLPKAVIIQSSFGSQAEMAKDILPIWLYYFLQVFMDHTLDSKENLKKISSKTKIIVAHSKEDELIKFNHSKSLSNNVVVLKGNHNNNVLTDEFWQKFIGCLE